ncbi:MAG: 3-isopropylmalate dehydratase large subunit [Dehalococcoidia bacterium]|nr:3-isopropylmalate dehydratase large subunit [Dehalococcoidia bacterium]
MGMTMAEKILASHSGRGSVKPGEFVWCNIDVTSAAGLRGLEKLGVERVWDPQRIYVVDDHLAPPTNISTADDMVAVRRLVGKYGITHFYEYGRHGIQHQVLPEHGYVVPGDLIAMADSHSTTGGAFNAAVTCTTGEAIYIMITGRIWLMVPESIKVELTGTIPPWCVGKDVVLKIAGDYGTEVGLYKSLEFSGPGVKQLSMGSRMTIANMGVELGAKFAIFPCDETTMGFLEGRLEREPRPVAPDPDAVYSQVMEINLTGMEPQIACPHDPGNVHPVSEVAKQHMKVQQAFLGSCTNGRLEDMVMAAKILKGRKVHPNVRMIASPASMEQWKAADELGVFKTLTDAEVMVAHPTCGPCYGGHLGIIGKGEVCISSTNRNFQGRMGSPESFVYLAGPASVAAAAVAGEIVDPREFYDFEKDEMKWPTKS